jgi:hypothetical protein
MILIKKEFALICIIASKLELIEKKSNQKSKKSNKIQFFPVNCGKSSTKCRKMSFDSGKSSMKYGKSSFDCGKSLLKYGKKVHLTL